MNIVFAKTRWVYDSYTDFWDLVRLSDFPTCFIDEMNLDDSNTCYITAPMNGEIQQMEKSKMEAHKCIIALWNLERPGGSGGIQEYIDGNKKWLDAKYIDYVLVSDRKLSVDTGFSYIPLYSHPDFGTPGTEKLWDIVHLMCYSNRRAYPWFKEPGVIRDQVNGISIAPNGWGETKQKSLSRSRFMLNIHQDEFLYIEPLRFALAAAYGLPVITEACHDLYPYYDIGFVQSGKDDILDTIKTSLRKYVDFLILGMKFREQFAVNRTFRSGIEDWL